MSMKRSQAENSLRAALAIVFGNEWIDLSAADKALIVRDCIEDGRGLDLGIYRANIGPGNLQAYAKVMRVRFASLSPIRVKG